MLHLVQHKDRFGIVTALAAVQESIFIKVNLNAEAMLYLYLYIYHKIQMIRWKNMLCVFKTDYMISFLSFSDNSKLTRGSKY